MISYTTLISTVMILLVVGIYLVVGMRIDSSLKDDLGSETSTITLTNSTTKTVVNSSAFTYPIGISNVNHIRSCALTITEAANTTSVAGWAQAISSGNYTITGCKIKFSSVSATDAMFYNNTQWNITGTATYKTDTVEYNASVHALEGMKNVSEQQGLLGTIIIFGAVLSVVIIAFMARGMM